MKALIAALALGALALGASAQSDGSWAGALTVGPGSSLRLAFNVAGDKATLDSPDQNKYGIPMEVLYNRADSVSLAVRQIGLTFEGREQDGTLRGTFRQGALTLPLTLTRSTPLKGPEAAPAADRPQTPRPPFPYTVEEVSVDPSATVHLGGSLTIPADFRRGVTPVVLMVSGSGLQNRDEEIAGHRPFAVLADQLARSGIASLRYDDRGVGASRGPVESATTADFAADARAWLPLLRAQGFGPVGILGHSEGARIAFAIPEADFAIGLGLPAMRGDSILVDQNRPALLASGVTAEAAERYLDALTALYARVNAEGRAPADAPGLVMALTDSWPSSREDDALAGNLMAVARELAAQPWLLHFVQDSPVADINAWKKPALAIYGELDQQVLSPQNPDAVCWFNPEIDVRVFPGLNHMMQPCTTGAPSEYGNIDITVAPGVIDAVTSFVLAQKR